MASVYREFFAPKNPLEQYLGREATITGEVANDIEFKGRDFRVQLKTDYGSIYLVTENELRAQRSDSVTVTGSLQSGFGNYVAFMYRPKIVEIAHPSTPDFALHVRDIFANNVKTNIGDEDSSNLALSYLTGQKTLLSLDQKEKLRLVGLAHVVVASGYHLSIVVGIAKKYFKKISRFATFCGAILFIVVYVSITGFSPSMARAGLMTSLSLWAWYFGRSFHPLRLIIYVAAISLIIDPSYISNLAWQLSFASYTGIMLLAPLLTRYLYGDEKPGYFANIIIVSISAQLFCLPLTIYNFGMLPLLALVANLLVTPTVPIVMLLTFIAGIINIVPLAFAAQKLLQLHLFIIDAIASIPWSNISLDSKNVLFFLAYIPIIIVVALLKRRTKYSYHLSMVKYTHVN